MRRHFCRHGTKPGCEPDFDNNILRSLGEWLRELHLRIDNGHREPEPCCADIGEQRRPDMRRYKQHTDIQWRLGHDFEMVQRFRLYRLCRFGTKPERRPAQHQYAVLGAMGDSNLRQFEHRDYNSHRELEPGCADIGKQQRPDMRRHKRHADLQWRFGNDVEMV